MLNSRKRRSVSFPRGVCPDARHFAMSRQIALLEKALASWPRRHAPLLEVNCGNGAFLEFLWGCGFDVRGVESDAELRLCAQKRAVPDLEIYSASDDDLPFDNDEFDWVIVHLKTGEREHVAACAVEAARLARRGIMITFWNTQSLPGLCWRLFHSGAWVESSVPWSSVWHQLNRLNLGVISTFSTLASPVCLWRRAWLPGSKDGMRTFFGSWCAVRVDIKSLPTSTPLPLRLNIRLEPAEAAMEYGSEQSCSETEEKKA